MSQNPGRRGLYGDTEGSETDGASDDTDDTDTPDTVTGDPLPESGIDDTADTDTDIDPGSSPAPSRGQTPPEDTQEDTTDTVTGDPTPESDIDDTADTDTDIDPGSSPAPSRGQTPPEDTQEDTTEESPTQEDGDFYDPTVTQTAPVAGQTPPPSTDDTIEGIDSSEEADIRQDVADQYDNVFYNDITLEREELSEQEVTSLREEAAAERDISPERIEFEQTPFQVVPDISEAGQERAAEVDFAQEYEGMDPYDVDVDTIDDGQADITIEDQDARERVQTQQQLDEAADPVAAPGLADDQETQSLEEGQEILEDTDVTDRVEGTSSFGQTTDPDYDPADAPEGTIDYASEAIGLDIEEATAVTGATLVDQPIDSTITGFQTIGRGAGIDEQTVQAAEQTPSTLVNQPVESAVTGFETGIDVADQGIEDLETELEGGIGPGTAAVPAVGVGTGSATGTTVGAGTAATGAAVAAPVTAGVLGVRGIQQRDDVTIPAPETDTGEIPVQEGTTEVDELSPAESTVQEQSEIDVTDATLEEQPEITVEDGTLGYEPEITVDETVASDGTEQVDTIETGTAVEQPTGGFDDLPRGEETPLLEEEEATIGEGAVSEEMDRYEETTGSSFVFPGEESESVAMQEYDPQVGYNTDLGLDYGYDTDSSLFDGTMPEFGVVAGPGVATDVTTGIDVGMENEAVAPTESIPEMEFEYPSPESPGYDYPFEYGYDYSSRDRSRRRLRFPNFPDDERGQDELDMEMEGMFSFDIEEGSYFDIL